MKVRTNNFMRLSRAQPWWTDLLDSAACHTPQGSPEAAPSTEDI